MELGIGVYFEKENINIHDSKGEVLLTILSSLAQDESCSISENSTATAETVVLIEEIG